MIPSLSNLLKISLLIINQTLKFIFENNKYFLNTKNDKKVLIGSKISDII